MPLNINLPTNRADGDPAHTAGHNATNTALNSAGAAVDAHEAATTSVHGITDTAALETSAGATAKVSAHVAATDPHGDRVYTDGQVATRAALSHNHAQSDVTGLTTALAAKAADASVVHLAGTETVTGDKTFTGATVVPTPTLAGHAVTKAYVDKAWEFHVEDYGAVGNNSTNDQSAINSAITAAVNYAVANNGYAEVVFGPKVYVVSGALTQGGATKGNALIPLPVIATTAQKVTLKLRGVGDAANPHWGQSAARVSGTVIRTTLTGQAYSGTYGLPSIIGGPTPEQGYGTTGNLWNNVCLTVEGIQLLAPPNPTLCGIDLRGTAACNIINASAFTNQTPAASAATLPTEFNTALLMPLNGNNDYTEIGEWTANGWYCGVALSEHTVAKSIRTISCTIGMRIIGPNNHGISVLYASVENCPTSLEHVEVTVAWTAKGSFVHIAQLDVESYCKIYDFNNQIYGYIGLNTNGGQETIDITGASAAQIIDLTRSHGAVTAPAVPATTVALTNPFWRDAAVSVAGGTVTAIAVAGTSTGLTSGTVIVPSGKTITLTYSSAPTWVWTLL